MRRELLAGHPVQTAKLLLGAVLWSGSVAVRIVETEAYGGDPAGPWPDPASHSGRGPTPRNTVMYGPAGRLYVYLSYGVHQCANVTCGPDGTAGAVLLRAGEVIAGLDVAQARRAAARTAPASTTALARGPGNLAAALGLTLADNDAELCDPAAPIRLERGDRPDISSGPRVGVSTAADRPWRFWVPGSPAVSAYRRSPRAAAPAGK